MTVRGIRFELAGAPARLSARINAVYAARGSDTMFGLLIAFLLDVINEGPRIL